MQSLSELIRGKHGLVAGPTGTGKNNLETTAVLEMRKLRIGMTLILPHPNGYEPIIRELLAREIPSNSPDQTLKRFLFEDAGDVTNVVMRPVVLFSNSPNFYKRKLENALFEERALEPCVARLAEGTKLSDTPAKEKSARLAIRVFQEVRRLGVFISEADIPNLINPRHPAFHVAYNTCDPEDPIGADLIRELDVIRNMPLKEFFTHVESAIRFFEPVYRSAVIMTRTSLPSTFDRQQFFANGGIHIITKGNASDEDFGTLVSADFLHKYRMAMDGDFSEHYYWIDEANNYPGLMSDFVARAMSTSRYRKFFVWPMVQLRDFPTLKIERNVLSNCSVRFLFRQEDPDEQEFWARDLRGVMDENKVHHHDDINRQVHDGFEEIERVSRAVSKRHKADDTTTEHISKQMIPRYRDVIEQRAVYQQSNEQVFWLAQALGELPIGSCWVKNRGTKPVLLHVPLIRDSFIWERVAQRKVAECIRQLLQKAPYVTPAIPSMPVSQAGTNSLTSGMVRSSNSSGSATSQPRGSSSGRGSSKRRNGHAGG